MNAARQSSGNEPIWTTIKYAVDAGQSKPEAREIQSKLAEILALPASEITNIQDGITKIVGAVRQRDEEVIRRILRMKDNDIVNATLAPEFIRRGWSKYEKIATTEHPAVEEIKKAYEDVNNDEVFSGESLLGEAWKKYSRIPNRFAGTTDPAEQYRTGALNQVNLMIEWLRVLIPTYQLQMDSQQESKAAKEIEMIAQRSIPALLQAYSSMTMDRFRWLLELSTITDNPKTSGKHQNRELRQDPQRYQITHNSGNHPIFTVQEEVRKQLIEPIVSYVCAAKYAQGEQGSVLSALSTKTLRYWRRHILPLAFDNAATLTPDSIARYNEELYILQGKRRERSQYKT